MEQKFRLVFEGTIDSERLPELLGYIGEVAGQATVRVEVGNPGAKNITATQTEADPQYDERFVIMTPLTSDKSIPIITVGGLSEFGSANNYSPGNAQRIFNNLARGALYGGQPWLRQHMYIRPLVEQVVGLRADELDKVVAAFTASPDSMPTNLGSHSLKFLTDLSEAIKLQPEAS